MALKFADVAETLDWCGWLKTHYIGNFLTWGVYAGISQGAPHSNFGIALLCFSAFLGSLFSLHICFGEGKLFCFLSGFNFWKGYDRKVVKRPVTSQVSCPHGGFAGSQVIQIQTMHLLLTRNLQQHQLWLVPCVSSFLYHRALSVSKGSVGPWSSPASVRSNTCDPTVKQESATVI